MIGFLLVSFAIGLLGLLGAPLTSIVFELDRSLDKLGFIVFGPILALSIIGLVVELALHLN